MNVNRKTRLLIVDDDPVIRDSIRFVLQNEFQIETAESRSEVRELLDSGNPPPDLCLLDLGLPPHVHEPGEGFDVIGDLLAASPLVKILVLSGQDNDANIKRALTLGAFDFIAKPCDMELLRSRLNHALFIQLAEVSQQRPALRREPDDGMLGESAVVKALRAQIEQFADTPFPVLVEGESGTGKELVLQALHRHSQRSDKPFLVLNCAAISAHLMEAQLFGHAKGAFTGATAARSGFFEDVGEGTLCLDEIGEMPLELQAKLLRVLENGEFYRLGETNVRGIACRIVAATNRDLRKEVGAGRFREDLYHRLSVFRIQVPPLRQRGEDRLLLLEHFSAFYSRQLKTPPFRLDAQARQAWLDYAFPGNVRELRNIIIRLCTRFPGQEIGLQHLAEELEQGIVTGDDHSINSMPNLAAATAPATMAGLPADLLASMQKLDLNLDQQLEQIEQQIIELALQQTGGNLSKAARMLGVNRTTLYSRMQKVQKAEA